MGKNNKLTEKKSMFNALFNEFFLGSFPLLNVFGLFLLERNLLFGFTPIFVDKHRNTLYFIKKAQSNNIKRPIVFILH